MMKNYIDRKILETLITKYGAKGVNSAINRLNENNENLKSGIFIESHDHLNCDAFRILVLDNGENVLKNDPLKIECESQYSGKQYIENLEPKYGNDYIEVNYVGDLWEKSLCLINVVKALHIKYPELPIYCFTMGWNTWKGGYVDEQKAFNSIFSKYLRGISFEFIPGTMGEFLKSDINESLITNRVNLNKPFYVTKDNVEYLIANIRNTYPEIHHTDIRAFFGGWQNGVWEFEPEWFETLMTWEDLIDAFDDWLNNEGY